MLKILTWIAIASKSLQKNNSVNFQWLSSFNIRENSMNGKHLKKLKEVEILVVNLKLEEAKMVDSKS